MQEAGAKWGEDRRHLHPVWCLGHQRSLGQEQYFCCLFRAWLYQAADLAGCSPCPSGEEAWRAAFSTGCFCFLLLSQVLQKVKFILLQLPLILLLNWAVKLETIHRSPIAVWGQQPAAAFGKAQDKRQSMLSWGSGIPLCWAWRGIWNSDLASWTKDEFAATLSVVCLHFSPFTLLRKLLKLPLNWQLPLVMSDGFGVWVISVALEYCLWVMEIIYVW